MNEKHRIAIIVQRWHPSVAGGSEALAWQYATLLKDQVAVDLLTTTAIDAVSWKNELPPGRSREQGVEIRRFEVEAERTNYWHALHERLIADADRFQARRYGTLDHREGWTVALQREFIAKQGPYAPKLWRYIQESNSRYAALIFITYLYPTSYFGIEAAVGHPNILLVPTLHDEPIAYLSTYRHMARSVRQLLWNAEAERRLTFELWGSLPGEIVSIVIPSRLYQAEASSFPYLLYSGRIDSHKGCPEVLDFFMEFKKRYPSRLRLKLTGVLSMELPQHPDIEFLGFVSEEEKTRLMAGAKAFVMPSAHESLSIASLEAMVQETPVLANGRGPVVSEHLASSGGGNIYMNRESFVTALHELLENEELARDMGLRGRQYVLKNYGEETVRERLRRAIGVGSFSDGLIPGPKAKRRLVQ